MTGYHRYLLQALGLLLLTSHPVQCQDYTAGDIITLQVQDFALIETNHAPIALTLSTTTAGKPVTAVSNSDMFVRVSSIVPGGTDREITVRIAAGIIPTGTQLTVISAPCTTTNSGGLTGVPVVTPTILDEVDQLLVTQIGSCYTGTGYNDGFQLTFMWSPTVDASTYGVLLATQPTDITIVLTLTAHDGN